ncbi:MAG: hypothetical protein ACYCS7_03910 [Acidimicrobiales bacterium]
MFKKRAKKVAGGADVPEREKFPGWGDADQKVRDWWIGLEAALGREDPEGLRQVVASIRLGDETITDLWEAWTSPGTFRGRSLPERHPEHLREQIETVRRLVRRTRQRKEEADFAGRLDADLERRVRENLDGEQAGEHAREWWRLFKLAAFSDPASGLADLMKVRHFLDELTDRQASLAEAYLAWLHTEHGPETLLAYLDGHRDELRREAAQGADNVPIPRHPYLWPRERLRQGTDWYFEETTERASPEAVAWWRGVAEKCRGQPVALFSLLRDVARRGASLDELHAAGTDVEWDSIEALRRSFEERMAGRSLTSVSSPGTLRNVGPSKTQRTEIKTPEGQGLEALKAPAYLNEAERAALATIGKLLEEHPRLASLVREKCDEISPEVELRAGSPPAIGSSERVIRIREAAERTGLNPQYIKKLAMKGEVGELKDGRYVLSEKEIMDLAARPTPKVGRPSKS